MSLKREILYAVARAEDGQIVHAEGARKGVLYFCVSCNGAMVPRQGKKKRPHFAHKSLSPNCSPESALHYGFKTLLHARIQRQLNQARPIPLRWKCNYCSKIHQGNLLKRSTQALLEFPIDRYRPDLALLDQTGSVVAAIEIIVTHSPTLDALAYYEANRIPVLLFQLGSDSELARIDAYELEPDEILNLCVNPRCPVCAQFMLERIVRVLYSHCWNCRSPMVVAALEDATGLNSNFSAAETAELSKLGANIQFRYSAYHGSRIPANVCAQCNAHIGLDYLFTQYFAGRKDEEQELIPAGYYCEYCAIDD